MDKSAVCGVFPLLVAAWEASVTGYRFPPDPRSPGAPPVSAGGAPGAPDPLGCPSQRPPPPSLKGPEEHGTAGPVGRGLQPPTALPEAN